MTKIIADKFYKSYVFIVSAALTLLMTIESFFQFIDPAVFGEVGTLGFAAVGAVIALLRALHQKNMEPDNGK